MNLKKEILLKDRMVAFKQIFTASNMQDGYLFSLAFKAFLTAVRPSLLSMLENIENTSHETNKVPVGKGPLVLRYSFLLSKSVVSLINDGNL